jgi:hypothetical protein
MSAPVPDAWSRFHRILAEIASAPESEALGALVLGVLSRQAEGRTLFASPELVEGMAREHGVSAEQAELPSANVLTVLKRGPQAETEHLLLAGLAVHGLASGTVGSERASQLERFARHAVWLESCTAYEVFPFVDLILADHDAARVYGAVAAAVLGEDTASVAARARNAARLTVLTRSTSPAAVAPLGRVTAKVTDPASRAFLASVADEALVASARTERTERAPLASPGAPAAPDVSSVRGRLDRPPPASGLRGLLRLVTGVALFQWIARLLMASVGLRAEGEIALTSGGDLRIRRTTRLLGKVVRDREDVVPRAALERVGRHARYPALSLLIGALALAGGVVLGGLVLVDGARSGDTLLLLAGAAAVLGGGLCDLVASAFAAGRRGRVSVFVHAPRQTVCVSGVEGGEAEHWLAAFEAAAPAS